MEKIKNWFTRIKASFADFKGLYRGQYKVNKDMVDDYIEQSEKEKPKYRWYEWFFVVPFHVIMAIPFVIAGLILELKDWMKKRKKKKARL